jgi:hypothetical protein
MHFARFISTVILAASTSLFSGSSEAATVPYEFSFSLGVHQITGQISGLLDNAEDQTVSGFSIASATLPVAGVFNIANANKNEDFSLANGLIDSGHLKFGKVGEKTAAEPEFTFEVKWKDGVLDKFKFESDNGTKKGDLKFDFKDDGVLFSMGPATNAAPVIPATPPLLPVPLPAGGVLFLTGLIGLWATRWLPSEPGKRAGDPACGE